MFEYDRGASLVICFIIIFEVCANSNFQTHVFSADYVQVPGSIFFHFNSKKFQLKKTKKDIDLIEIEIFVMNFP